ncbi:MAG: hypothetical protein ACREXQ_15030, partial [Polaromonas sp.]
MSLLGKQLQIDFLPGRTIGVNVLVAKKFRRIGRFFGKVAESFLVAQSGQLVDQQGAIHLQRAIERDKPRIRAREL